MLPPTRDFTQTGCTVNARLVTYEQLERWYCCNQCGGAIVHKSRWDTGSETSTDFAECGACGARDFVSRRLYERQEREFPYRLRALPEELQSLVQQVDPVTYEQAIEELFGTPRDQSVPVDHTRGRSKLFKKGG